MEEGQDRIVSPSTETGATEGRMLGAGSVREIIGRKERGEGIKRIASELGVDRKTVKRWLKLGGWQPGQRRRQARQLDRFAEFITQRAPEVGWNGAVLYRELQSLGFRGGHQQVQRFLRPHREQRRWKWRRSGLRPPPASKRSAQLGAEARSQAWHQCAPPGPRGRRATGLFSL
jgi:hypothetical protein